MSESPVLLKIDNVVATVSLYDPGRRNALGLAMFDALDEAMTRLAEDEAVIVVIVRGEGPAFCAGFDLGAAVDDPAVMAAYIERLSRLLRSIRRLPQVVIAAVHGAAIAGGCAILSACDFVCVSPATKLGYPVHALGVSPAVNLPTMMQIVGDGPARALVMTGEMIDGIEAHRIGLASQLTSDDAAIVVNAQALAEKLASHGHRALRITKAWMNELDGSLDDERFSAPVHGSIGMVTEPEAVQLLRTFWASRGEPHTGGGSR